MKKFKVSNINLTSPDHIKSLGRIKYDLGPEEIIEIDHKSEFLTVKYKEIDQKIAFLGLFLEFLMQKWYFLILIWPS